MTERASRMGWLGARLLGLTLLGVPGCGDAPAGAPDGPAAGPATPVAEVVARDADSLTVRHPGGETRVPRAAQRVLAIGDPDSLYFLGVKPLADAGLWDFEPDGYLERYRRGVGHVGGSYGARIPDAESALTFAPDLIVLQTFDRSAVARLQQVAPTVVMPSWDAGPRARALAAGRVLGVEERALRAIAWYDAKVAGVRALLAEHVGERPVAVFWLAVKQIRLHDAEVLYDELGLAKPRQLAPGHPWRVVLQLERLGELDAEVIFVIHSIGATERNLDLDRVAGLPMWQSVPAVRAGRVFAAGGTGHWISGNLLGRSIVMNELVEALVPPERVPAALAPLLVDRPDDAALARFAPVDPATVVP